MNKIAEVVEKKRRFAVFPIVCADHCAHLLNVDFTEVAHRGEKLAEVLLYGYETYQYDMVLIFCDAYVEAQAMGCNVEFTPYPRLLTSIPQDLLLNPPSIPPFIKGETGGLNDGKVVSIDRTGEIIKAARTLKGKVDVPVFVSIKGPFTLAAFLAGIDEFLKMVLKDVKKAREVIERVSEFQLEYLERLLAVGVNIFIGDPLASTSVVSPEIFEKFAYEPLKLLIAKVKEKGCYAGIHICGETKPIMSLLDHLSADILSVEDISLPTKTLRMGGVSTTTIVSGTKEKIKEEVIVASKQSYLILSTTCDVPVETKPENIKAITEFHKQL